MLRPEVRWGHRAIASVHPKCERPTLARAPAGIRHAARDSSAWATVSLRLSCYCGNASVQVQLVGQTSKTSEHRGSSSLRDPPRCPACAQKLHQPVCPLTTADESTSQHLPMVWARCHSAAALQLYKHPRCRERSPHQSSSAWNRLVVRSISTRHLERLAADDVCTCEHRATIRTRRHGAAAFQRCKHTSCRKCYAPPRLHPRACYQSRVPSSLSIPRCC